VSIASVKNAIDIYAGVFNDICDNDKLSNQGKVARNQALNLHL